MIPTISIQGCIMIHFYRHHKSRGCCDFWFPNDRRGRWRAQRTIYRYTGRERHGDSLARNGQVLLLPTLTSTQSTRTGTWNEGTYDPCCKLELALTWERPHQLHDVLGLFEELTDGSCTGAFSRGNGVLPTPRGKKIGQLELLRERRDQGLVLGLETQLKPLVSIKKSRICSRVCTNKATR